ncbi:MAG: iron-containing alcohol dehydrogenase, partial [Deltaproteobacteria bacterium]|nr:iron-containing alcohol dehydrogenase [Deltaproteobacteria bacterium]
MTYNDDLNFLFFSPTKIIFGTGSLKELPAELDAAGGNRAVIVTDDFLRGNTGIIEQAGNFLGKRCAGVFSGVPSDSGVHAVEDVARFAKDAGADSLVSIGGGSVIDTAKGAAILVKEGGGLRDYEGFQNLTRKIAPHIAVPTTAGTGSEVTYVAVIKDHENHRKLLFGDYHLIPDSAILDPALTATMPAGLTAATGMDAMSHAIEAMHSQQREPV